MRRDPRRLAGTLRHALDLGDRHRIVLNFYEVERSSRVALSPYVLWEGAQLPAGAGVHPSLDWRLLPISYAYGRRADGRHARLDGLHRLPL